MVLLSEVLCHLQAGPPLIQRSRRRHSVDCVTEFEGPKDLVHNRGLIDDRAAFARDHNAASWLSLGGGASASMDGGMSYADVRARVPASENVVSDPPAAMTM